MTPTINMADTGHDTDHANCLSYQTRTPSGNATSYHSTGYRHTAIRRMEIPGTGINFVLLALTWTSRQKEYPVNNQRLVVTHSATTGTDAWRTVTVSQMPIIYM